MSRFLRPRCDRSDRHGSIPADEATRILSQLATEEGVYYLVAGLPEPLITEARRLADRHGLRTLDAVQLATALAIFEEATAVGLPLTFVSADLELNAAATQEGLPVANPESYP